MENEIDLADEAASWWNHSAARSAHARFMKERDSALAQLLSIAADTADPKVAMAYGRYKAYAEHVKFYEAGRRRGGS